MDSVCTLIRQGVFHQEAAQVQAVPVKEIPDLENLPAGENKSESSQGTWKQWGWCTIWWGAVWRRTAWQ